MPCNFKRPRRAAISKGAGATPFICVGFVASGGVPARRSHRTKDGDRDTDSSTFSPTSAGTTDVWTDGKGAGGTIGQVKRDRGAAD